MIHFPANVVVVVRIHDNLTLLYDSICMAILFVCWYGVLNVFHILCTECLISSQVDYRAKVWSCNFCFQRNQVIYFIICHFIVQSLLNAVRWVSSMVFGNSSVKNVPTILAVTRGF